MKSAITAILKSLQALKSEGVDRVVVADETLLALKKSLGEATSSSTDSGSVAEISRPVVPAVDVSAERVARKAVVPAQSVFPPPPKLNIPQDGSKAERLEALHKLLLSDSVCCTHCHAGKKLVFGIGNPESPVFFCGEAPGAEEEQQGEPFVGPAGQLLTKIIAATGMDRRDVYIGNIMAWRPEMPTAFGNRPPTAEEMAYCIPYLSAQIEIVRPRVIVALGITAVNGLLGTDPNRTMGGIRGKQFEFLGIPVVPTYHPSYLLRSGSIKSKRLVWEDFMKVMELLGMDISEKQRGYFLPKV